jgi:hypothetical protein
MLRARKLVLLSLAALSVVSCAGGPVATVERPEGRFAPEIITRSSAVESAEIKIGDFEKPEGVPEYEVIERREIRRDGVKAARLLVDTKVETEADYELIARDIKSAFASYDAVSAEVTDTSEGFDYDGAILVFNTPEGSYYMGFYYSPPSNLGYIVDVAE